MASLSIAQHRVLALLPKITGWSSLLFSSFLAATVLRDKARRSNCYHRLMLGVSLADISASTWMGMSTWPIPRGSEVWALGNETTCRVQGFFVHCSIMSSFYNASLSIYFWLVIVKGWNEERLRNVEWILHCAPVGWALCTALLGLYLDVYANAFLWCWVSPEWQVFRWCAYYVPLWTMISIVTWSCVAIYMQVRKLKVEIQTRTSRSDSLGSSKTEDLELEEMVAAQPSAINSSQGQESRVSIGSIYRQARRVKQVAQQCFLYAAAFYVNWIALTAVRLIQAFDGTVHFPLLLIAAITVPMQGLPNFLVYLRPRIRRARRLNPSAKWYKWLVRSVALDDSNLLSMSRRHTSVVASASPGAVNTTVRDTPIVGEDGKENLDSEEVVSTADESHEVPSVV